MNEYWIEFSDGTHCYMFADSLDDVRPMVIDEMNVWGMSYAAAIYDSKDRHVRRCLDYIKII